MDYDKMTREQLIAALVDLRQADKGFRNVFDMVERAKQEWEAVADSLSHVICLLDKQGQMLRANRAVEQWNLGNVKEARGKTVHELLHSKCTDPDCYLKNFWPRAMEELAQGRSSEIECKDHILNIHLSVKPMPMIHTAGKERVKNAFAIVIVEDITRRVRAMEELRRSEEKYRDLFENANDLIQSVAEDGSFIYVNHAWRKALGYDETEVSRLSYLDVVHPDDREHYVKAFRCLMTGEEFGRFEVRFITRHGEPIALEGNVNCVCKDGKAVATRGIFRDITQRKELEEVIQNKILELEKFHRIVVGRELRMKELKLRIKDLEEDLRIEQKGE